MNTFELPSHDEEKIWIYTWDDVEEPKGVLQLIHGMSEHLGRYDDFAKYLNAQGYIVIGDDHRAHGKTAGSPDKVGKAPEKGDLFSLTVKDEMFITDMIHEKYPYLPHVVLGHSYGSFMLQRYLEFYSNKIDAAIIMGSACMRGSSAAAFGRFVSKLMPKDKPAKLISKSTFEAYNKDLKGDGKWITRDREISDKYYADPYCTPMFTYGFYKSFFCGMKSIYRKSALKNVSKDLPIFIVSGSCDRVGGNGKLVKKLYRMYLDLGVKNVEMKLYEGGRHEILNELNRSEVYGDIAAFMDKIAAMQKKA